MELATNLVHVTLEAASWPSERLVVELANRQGWMVARIATPGWIAHLVEAERTSLQNALAILYTLGGVDMVHEQIDMMLGGTLESIQFQADGVTNRGAGGAKPNSRNEPGGNDASLNCVAADSTTSSRPISIAYEKLMFSKLRLHYADCERCWRDQIAGELLVPGWHFLPPAPSIR